MLIGVAEAIFTTILPVIAPPEVGDISGVLTLSTWLDSWLPVTEFLTVAGLSMVLEASLLTLATAMWTLGRFPFGKLFGGH